MIASCAHNVTGQWLCGLRCENIQFHIPTMRLRNDLEFVEFSNRRVVVREPPLYAGGFLLGVLGAFTLAAFLGNTGLRTDGLIVGIVAVGWLLGLGLYCCVDSTYTVAHGELAFDVRRELWSLKWARRYALSEISAITVRKTWRHGDGLVLQLASGKSKTLTWSLHFHALDREGAALNHAIHVGRTRAS